MALITSGTQVIGDASTADGDPRTAEAGRAPDGSQYYVMSNTDGFIHVCLRHRRLTAAIPVEDPCPQL